MKDGKYEVKDLDGKDYSIMLLAALISKGIITQEEFDEIQQEYLDVQNKRLEEEIKKNPWAKIMADILSK